MPFVTFSVRRGLSNADKFHLSAAMIEAQVAAGFQRNDLFHRFLEVNHGDLVVDPRYPDYITDRTDRFMVVEVAIGVKLWSQVPGFRLHAYPQFSCKRHGVEGSNFSDFSDEMRATKAEWQTRNPKLAVTAPI